jgi:hypothetical protein
MKKEQNQLITPLTNEPIISSTALTLLQFKKDAEKKETAAESAKVRCRICFKEIAPTPRCFGHGGGSGGGDGNSSETSEDKGNQSNEKSLNKTDTLTDDTDAAMSEYGTGTEYAEPNSELAEKKFASQIIAELVAKGLLIIANDREDMSLTIRVQCELNSLSKEERQELNIFLEAIIKEFSTFKEHHHLPDDCITVNLDGDEHISSLCIKMPTLVLYDAFIRQLANNLRFTSSPKVQTKNPQGIYREVPTPLSLEPKPFNTDIPNPQIEIVDKECELFNPSPFLTQMKP